MNTLLPNVPIPANVETPVTFRVVAVIPTPVAFTPPPKVEMPEVTSMPFPNVAIPMNVETPDTVKSSKVFGAFEIAASIVAVVVASSEAIF